MTSGYQLWGASCTLSVVNASVKFWVKPSWNSEQRKELQGCQPWNLWVPELIPDATYLWTFYCVRKNKSVTYNISLYFIYIYIYMNCIYMYIDMNYKTYLTTEVLKYNHRKGSIARKLSFRSMPVFQLSLQIPSRSHFSPSARYWFISLPRRCALMFGLWSGTDARQRHAGGF